MPASKRKQRADLVLRRRIVRRLMVDGVPDGEIKRRLAAGVKLDGGPTLIASEATVRNDIKAIEAQFGPIWDDENARARELWGCRERMRRIAVAAESDGKYTAAVKANVVLWNMATLDRPELHLSTGHRPRHVVEDLEYSQTFGGQDDSDDQAAAAESSTVSSRRAALRKLPPDKLAGELARAADRGRALGLHLVPPPAPSSGGGDDDPAGG